MHLDLSDEEAAGLANELHRIVENDRYPFSPRIRALRAIPLTRAFKAAKLRPAAQLRPEPAREPMPPRKVYAPPRATATKRRRAGG